MSERTLQWLAMSVVACVVIGLPIVLAAESGGNQDPATARIPDLQTVQDDPRRAIVLEVSFGPGETASIESMAVSETPPGALDDDPLFLSFVTFDRDGLPLFDQYGWDPRWSFEENASGGEQAVFVDEVVSIVRLPFDHRIRGLAIFNLRGEPGVPLLETDITTVVANFCSDNPTNVNCEGFVILPLFADGFE